MDLAPLTRPDKPEWSLVERWTSPVSDAVYEIYRTWTDARVRIVGKAGTFANLGDLYEAEVAATGLPRHLFKAERGLREDYLAGKGDVRRLVITLRDQPVADFAPGVWAEHRRALERVEARARANRDPRRGLELAREIESLRESIIAEIFELADPIVRASQSSAAIALRAVGSREVVPITVTLSSLGVTDSVANLERITALDEVARVEEARLEPVSQGTSVNATGQFSYAGAGYHGGTSDVAVVDTGVDFAHPALRDRSFNASNVKYFIDPGPCFDDDLSSSDDFAGHGTWVAGVVGSLGAFGFPSPVAAGMMQGSQTGIINLKSGYKRKDTAECGDGHPLIDASGAAQNVDWSIREYSRRADVISNSWGGGTGLGQELSYFDSVAMFLDIPVVFSAGNRGPADYTVGDHARGPNVIAVAASDDKDTVSRSDDTIADFSSRGGALLQKPDIAAPGVDIYSPSHTWELGAIGSEWSGTSAAAPHVSGAAALALGAGVGGALRFKTTIMNAATTASGRHEKDRGWGFLDLDTHYGRFKAQPHRYVEPVFAQGENRWKFYRLVAPEPADKITMHSFLRFTTGLFQLDSADLGIHSEQTGLRLNPPSAFISNTEQVLGSDFGAAADNVMTVSVPAVFPRVGLAASKGLQPLRGPEVFLTASSVPAILSGSGTGQVTATYQNLGDIRAHNLTLQMSLPPGYEATSPNSQTVPALGPGESVSVSWTIRTRPGAACGSSPIQIGGLVRSYGVEMPIAAATHPSRINCAPVIAIQSPNGGEYLRGTQPVAWTVTDAEGHSVSSIVEYSGDGATYTQICQTTSTSCSWATTGLPDAGGYRVRVRASDGLDTSTRASDDSFTIDNTAPMVTSAVSGTLGGAGWYRSAVTVSLQCADATAGVQGISYRIDGGASTSYTGPFSIAGSGVRAVESTCIDKAGNSGAVSDSVKIDTTLPAPTASVSGTQGGDGWYRSTPAVTLGCSDAHSGVDAITYSVNGGVHQPYSSPFSVAAQGTSTVEVTCSDVAGNGKTIQISVKVDSVAPAMTHELAGSIGGGGWYRAPVTVALSCSDGTSGPGTTSWRADGSPYSQYAGPFQHSADGTAQFEALCSDKAGNESAVERFTVKIDSAPPTLTHSLTGPEGTNGWRTGAATISLHCSDSTSGVEGVTYKIGNGLAVPYQSAFTIGDEGDHDVSATCTDVAGHTRTIGFVVRIDFTPPALTRSVQGPQGENGWFVGDAVMSLACTDSRSGVESVVFSYLGVFAPFVEPFEVRREGENDVVAECVDQAGLKHALSFSIPIDKTAPRPLHSLVGRFGSETWSSAAVTYELSCTDGVSGPDALSYALDGAPFTTYSEPVVVSDEGLHEMVGRCTDEAGHQASRTAAFGVDVTSPAISFTQSGTVGSSGWSKGTVSVTIGCSDTLSGPGPISYRVAGGPQTEYTGEAIVVDDDGTTEIEAECDDVAANRGFAVDEVKIDRAPPQAGHSMSGPPSEYGWYGWSPYVTLTCSDNLSGVGARIYRIDDGEVVTYTEPFQIADEGDHVVESFCEDVVGNRSSHVFAVRIDATPPQAEITAPLIGTRLGGHTVHWTADDDRSGLARYAVFELGTLTTREWRLVEGCSGALTDGAAAQGSCERSPEQPDLYCYMVVVWDRAEGSTATDGSDCTIVV